MSLGPQLVVVRHGETEWMERGRLHGRLDSPLSTTGRRHAEMTAQRLQGEHFDALFSSPKGRARQTAEILGQAVGLTPALLDDLREADFGWLEGRPLSLIDPNGQGHKFLRPAAWLMGALTAERPGRVAKRVVAAVEAMTRQFPDGRLLVVTHWGVISMIMAQLVDQDIRKWRGRGPWAACGLSELHVVNGAWQVVRLNDHAHLH